VTENKKLVERLEDRSAANLGPLLADDVEWVEWVDGVPASGSVRRGKEAFIQNYGDDRLEGTITRMVEEGNVVVAEGNVRVTKRDGRSLTVQYCNIYELAGGKVKRKSSYGALVKDSA
jgi:ketosteroid isomerase-like protein